MEKARTFFRSVWFERGVAIILFLLFANYLHKVFTEYSMVYVDPDQLLMMFGTQEFLAGRFHMPRFYGQDYGSMLESYLAVPFAGLSLEVALPIASTILLLMPFLLIVWKTSRSPRALTFMLVWLLILPVEYFFIGTIPRDFVSGLAITSIALLFISSRKRIGLVLFGFFCLAGWSFNQNAALLGATITIYHIFAVQHDRTKRFVWISVGYVIGLVGHVGLQTYLAAHPEWIVHHAWPIQFHFELIAKGLSNLDTYWGALTPFAYRKSFVLVIFLVSIAVFTQNKAVRFATFGLILLTVLSFGVPKVHDGFISIFSPYERMFLALPVALFFLLIASEWHHRIPLIALLVIGLLFFNWRKNSVAERVLTHVEYGKDHIMPYAKMDGVYARAKFLNGLASQYDTDLILIGPDAFFADILVQKGHLGLKKDLLVVSPGFDRKTWLLRTLESRKFNRFLWLQSKLSKDQVENSTGLHVTEISMPETGFTEDGYYFLVEGEAINPLKVFEDCGFTVCNH